MKRGRPRNRVNGVAGRDLLDRLAATDRLHANPGLELGAVSTAVAHRWEPPSRGSTPPQRLTMGPVRKTRPPHWLGCRPPLHLPAKTTEICQHVEPDKPFIPYVKSYSI
jgi:hypothetical protein